MLRFNIIKDGILFFWKDWKRILPYRFTLFSCSLDYDFFPLFLGILSFYPHKCILNSSFEHFPDCMSLNPGFVILTLFQPLLGSPQPTWLFSFWVTSFFLNPRHHLLITRSVLTSHNFLFSLTLIQSVFLLTMKCLLEFLNIFLFII